MRKRKQLFNVANSLTLSRFVFAPIMLWLILRMEDPRVDPDAWKTSCAVFVLLLVTMLTDLFDGAVARARKEVTNFGKIMDPVADSTFFMTLLFGLSACSRYGAWVSLWVPILVLYREIAMQILRRYAALKGHAVPAKFSGKVKMFSQSVAMAVFFLMVCVYDWNIANSGTSPITEDMLRQTAWYVGWFTVTVNYLSMIEYSRDVPELIAEYTLDKDSA